MLQGITGVHTTLLTASPQGNAFYTILTLEYTALRLHLLLQHYIWFRSTIFFRDTFLHAAGHQR